MKPERPPPPYLLPGRIGPLELPNRLVRAATSETMAGARGEVTDQLVELYRRLGAGGAAVLISGHIFVEPGGRNTAGQMGLYEDSLIEGYARLTAAVHSGGGRIFAELSHAGSQARAPGIRAVSPSAVPNAMSATVPQEMTQTDIERVLASFESAARRAKAAGFDGIHIHGGNGYLISQFGSPYANRRNDAYGGNAERRGRFFRDVYRAVRAATGPDFPVTARIGLVDTVEGGLSIEEGVDRAKMLEQEGIDALEVTYGVMNSYLENIRQYAGLRFRRALADLVLHRLFAKPVPEAYYRPLASRLKAELRIPIILVGGLRSTDVMADILASGDADFLAMARPFIREPDLPNALARGRTGPVDCVSCNICIAYGGIEPVRCWRSSPKLLLRHAYNRFWMKRTAH